MKEIQDLIKKLITVSNQEANWSDGSSDRKMTEQESLMEKLTDLARKNKTLLGRIISYSVADGRAIYVITKVNEKSVKLVWIDFCDGYCDRHFGCRGGSLPIGDALSHTKFEDTLHSMKRL